MRQNKPVLTLGQIYEQHGKMVYNLCLSYVPNAQDAEELAQDVFITVHARLSSFRQQSALSTWIYRIAINKCLDFIRARQRKQKLARFTSLFYHDNETLRYHPVDFNHPGVDLEQKEAVEKIFAAIAQLPGRQKTAFILGRLEQRPQQEIAIMMRLNVKAVESLLQRARQNLSKKLQGTEG